MNAEEQKLLADRQAQFDGFLEELNPVLVEFAEDLGLPEPVTILTEPENFVEPLTEFMRDQTIGEEDRMWIMVRLAYFIGEVLAARLDGTWFVNEWPETRYFARYVVGEFEAETRPNAMFDPFEAAGSFTGHPPGRDLAKFIDEIEAACRS